MNQTSSIEDLFPKPSRPKNCAAINAECFAHGNRLDDLARFKSRDFQRSLTGFAERAGTVRIIDDYHRFRWQNIEVLMQWRNRAAMREHAVGEQNDPRPLSTFSDRERKRGGVQVLELKRRAAEEWKRVSQTLVRPRIDDCVRELTRQRLRHDKICGIAVGDDGGGLSVEELREFGFQLRI